LSATGFVIVEICQLNNIRIYVLPFALSVDLYGRVCLTGAFLPFFTGASTSKCGVGGVCSSVPLSGCFVVFEIAWRLFIPFQVEAVSFSLRLYY
jgi:hypothetical protein